MGAYANNLRRRMLDRAEMAKPKVVDSTVERLVSVAIQRNGETHSRGFRSHYELRAALNPDNADHRFGEPNDIEGFMTSEGRFVGRWEAVKIGVDAGQLHEGWNTSGRALLSSDINWNAK